MCLIYNKKPTWVNFSFQEDEHSFYKRRFLHQDTIEFGCPVHINLLEVIRFPGYTVKITESNKMQPSYSRLTYKMLEKGMRHRVKFKNYFTHAPNLVDQLRNPA